MGRKGIVQLVENRHLQELEERSAARSEQSKSQVSERLPEFDVGDTVAVHVVITEGDKSR